MSTYNFFKHSLDATKKKFVEYKKPSVKFYLEVKEIRQQLYTAVQYEEISEEEYKELDSEFERYSPKARVV